MSSQLMDTAGRINALIQQANDQADLAKSHATRAICLAVEAGNELHKAKRLYGSHGNWGDWLQENCNLDRRHASRYMELATLYPTLTGEQCRQISDLSVRNAITRAKTLLAPPRPAPETKLATPANLPLAADTPPAVSAMKIKTALATLAPTMRGKVELAIEREVKRELKRLQGEYTAAVDAEVAKKTKVARERLAERYKDCTRREQEQERREERFEGRIDKGNFVYNVSPVMDYDTSRKLASFLHPDKHQDEGMQTKGQDLFIAMERMFEAAKVRHQAQQKEAAASEKRKAAAAKRKAAKA